MKDRNILKVFRNRNFTIYSIAQTISLMGDKIDHMALIAVVKAMAFGSTAAFSNLAFFFTIPAIIFSPVVGILIDRWNRKRLLVIGDISRAILVLFIPFLVIYFRSLIPMYIVVFFVFLFGLVYNSTKMAVLPSLLKSKDDILLANSINTVLGRVATVMGLLIGGFVVDWELWNKINIEGWQAGFYLDAVTFFVSGILIMFIVLPHIKRKKPSEDLTHVIIEKEKSYFKKAIADLKEAMVLILKEKIISFVYFTFFALVFMGATVYVLVIILIQQYYGYGTTGVGKLGAITGIGMTIGAFLYGSVGQRWDRKKVIIFSFFVISFVMMFFPFFKHFLYISICAFIGGFLISWITISQDTLLHENVPHEFRGRIFSTKELLISGSFLIFAYPMGISAEFLYPGKMIFINGILLFLATLFFFFKTR